MEKSTSPGEKLTIESIVKEHGKRLLNLAYRICGDRFMAEDLLQESLVSIHEALPSFRGESSVYCWVYKITLNTCLKHTRGKQMQAQAKAALERLDSQGDPTAIRETDAVDGNGCAVDDGVAANPHDALVEQRIALLLKDLFDFSYKDMSLILEASEDVIRSRLSRARSALRRHFQKRCSWLDPGNPCRYKNRAGYVLGKYPSLAKNTTAWWPISSIAISGLKRTSSPRFPSWSSRPEKPSKQY